MVVLIIAGGSGTRLWPLSTPSNPKHLMNINNGDATLLQQTYERAKLLTDTIYVVTESGQINALKNQLPGISEDNIIVEPGPRGTANCIVAALEHLKDEYDGNGGYSLYAFADHYIRDMAGFVNSFNLAKQVSSRSHQIVLLGAEPDYPFTGFGYIEKGELLEKVSPLPTKLNLSKRNQILRQLNPTSDQVVIYGTVATLLEKWVLLLKT